MKFELCHLRNLSDSFAFLGAHDAYTCSWILSGVNLLLYAAEEEEEPPKKEGFFSKLKDTVTFHHHPKSAETDEEGFFAKLKDKVTFHHHHTPKSVEENNTTSAPDEDNATPKEVISH